MPRHSSLVALLSALVLAAPTTGAANADPLDLLAKLPAGPSAAAPSFPGLAPAAAAEPELTPELQAQVRRDLARLAGVTALAASPTWTFETNVANAQLGTMACTAGDVNGDGFSDMVAMGRSGSNDALYLFLGSPSGFALAPGYPLSMSPYSGGSARAAGDLNGDGYGDIAIGWPSATAGRLRVYYGNASGLATGSPFNYFLNFSVFWAQIVGPAGDVNGDGYDDLLIGSPSEGSWISCGGGSTSSEGRVDVFYGSASGVSVPNWILWGCQWASTSFVGAGTAAAGDVNADGYGDLVIGAPGATAIGRGSPHGSAWVVYGSGSGLPLLPGYANVGTLAGATRVDSPTDFAFFGASVSPAGDVNGDGYADVAVGAPYDDTYASDAGIARVYAGGPSGLQPGTVLWWEGSSFANTHFGGWLAPAGDVNGDGKGDLLVGEEGRVDVAQALQGTMYLNRFLTTPYPGYACTAGDVNGDGLSDVVLGNPNFTNGESFEGQMAVYSGSGDGPTTWSMWNVTTVYENPNMGWSVASAGDVNGDGLDDVLVGAPTWDVLSSPSDVDNGAVFLYIGLPTGLATSPSWYYLGATGDQVGAAVSGLGDVNGDGYADFAVGAHQPGYGNGKAHVFHGGPGISTTPNATLSGPSFNSYFGSAISGGDFNGDGYADLAVGAPYDDPSGGPPFYLIISDGGSAFMYLGGPGGIAGGNVWYGHGDQQDEHYATSLNGFADINADGYTDLVVGAPDLDIGSPFSLLDCGRVVEYSGGSTPGVLTFRQSLNGGPNERFGASVANAGDVNGDGYGDIVVGAPSANQTIQSQGRAAVHVGSGSGLGTSAFWSQLGSEAFGGYGSSVSGAGDINGDGLSDVLVGAVFQENGGAQDRGVARVYVGPLPGGAAAAWTVNGPAAFANVGHCVANAGDVNGDGWSDLILGEPGYTGDYYRQGRVDLFLGAYADSRLSLAMQRRTTAGPNIVPMGASAPGIDPVILRYAPSAAGRTKFKMQWDMRTPLSLPAPPIAGVTPAWGTTLASSYGQLGANFTTLSGMQTGAPYGWRMRARFKDVYYPTSRWASPVRSGVFEYDLRSPGTWVDVERGSALPTRLSLSEARPNPARVASSVDFALAHAGHVTLDVVDLQGRHVRTLVDGERPAGSYRAAWDGRDGDGRSVAAGVYFYRLRAAGEQASRKVAMLH